MLQVDGTESVPPEEPAPARSDRSDRVAFGVFLVAVVGAVPLILYTNRDQWFFLDEWDFLTRDLRSIDDMLRPHNEHWTTVPAIAYGVIFRVVGLHHYWPYQLLSIGAHAAAAMLVWLAMRRLSVDAWIATAGALVFLFLGSGRENFGWGFQVTFGGALAFGLGQLLLADHDGALGPRDLFGVLCGLAAVACAGPGLAVVVGVGISVFIRRGWLKAAAQVLPVALVYATWFLAYGHAGVRSQHATPAEGIEFAVRMIGSALSAIGQSAPITVLLAGLGIVGVIDLARAGRDRLGLGAGLLFAAVSFALLTGWARAGLDSQLGTSSFNAGRYVHILAALLLPIVAVGAGVVARRLPGGIVLVLIVLLAGIPSNVDLLEPQGAQLYLIGQPSLMRVVASEAGASDAPPEMEPLPFLAGGATVRWFAAIRAEDRISLPAQPPAPSDVAVADLALSLWQRPEDDLGTSEHRCRDQALGSPLALRPGDRLVVDSDRVVVSSAGQGEAPASLTYAARAGDERVILESVESVEVVVVTPSEGVPSTLLCR